MVVVIVAVEEETGSVLEWNCRAFDVDEVDGLNPAGAAIFVHRSLVFVVTLIEPRGKLW